MWMSMEMAWFTILIQVKADLGQRFLVSSVGRALHRYRRGHGFKSRTGLIFFFRPYFHYCLSTVHYCEDHFRIHAFIRSSNIWPSYIHSRLYIWSSQTSTYIYIYHIPPSIYLSIIYQYRGLACQVNQFFFMQIRRSVSSATQINKCLQWILGEKFLKEIHCCFGGGY